MTREKREKKFDGIRVKILTKKLKQCRFCLSVFLYLRSVFQCALCISRNTFERIQLRGIAFKGDS